MDLFRVLSLRLSQVIITMKMLARSNENGFNYSYHICIGYYTRYMDSYDIGLLCFVTNGAPLYACTMQNCRLLIMEMRL